MEVADYPSNSVEFKIDKRTQIVNTAEDWANYVWTYKREWGIGGDHWSICQGFAAHVYTRHGLTLPIGNPDENGNIAGNSQAQFNKATAPDDEPGALRFFWSHGNPLTTPGHTAIIGRNGKRIDNNGSFSRDWIAPNGDNNRYNGPTINDLNHGLGITYEDLNAGDERPRSQTLPGEKDNSKSLLKELDDE